MVGTRDMFKNIDSPDVLESSRPAEAVCPLLKEGKLTLHLSIRGKTDVITLSLEASMTLIHKDQWLIDHTVPRS